MNGYETMGMVATRLSFPALAVLPPYAFLPAPYSVFVVAPDVGTWFPRYRNSLLRLASLLKLKLHWCCITCVKVVELINECWMLSGLYNKTAVALNPLQL